MPKEYDNTNRGVLFKNDDKQEDTHPDYKGSIDVGGKEFWLAAWIKTSKKGGKFMSLSVKPKDAPRAETQRQSTQRAVQDMPDDIPF